MKAKLLNVIREQAKKISNINIIIKKVKINSESNTEQKMEGETQVVNNEAGEIEMKMDLCDSMRDEKKSECELTDKLKSENSYEYVIKNLKEKINLSYSDTLNPNFFPWFMIKGFSNLSPFDLHRIYMNELVPDECHYSRLILKKNFTSKKKTQKKFLRKKRLRSNTKSVSLNNHVEQTKSNNHEIFCYCRKPYLGDLMIGKSSFIILRVPIWRKRR